MSSIEIKEKEGIIKGATLLFTHTAKPDFNTKTQQSNGYVATALVDNNTGKEFMKNFPKSSCNMIETADIETKYGVKPVNPDSPIHYVVKIRANDTMRGDLESENLRKGDPVPMHMRPKAYQATPEGDLDITTTKTIGKGSIGDIAFTVRSDAHGKSVKLKSVRAETLVEYTPRGQTNEFGQPVISNSATTSAVSHQNTAPATSTAKPAAVVNVQDLDL